MLSVVAVAMEPKTIRFEAEEVEQLEREADERGFGNLTEYIRWCVRNRPAVKPTTAETLDERIDELEERLDRLENE